MCRSPKDHQQLHVGEQHVAPQLAQALTSSPQPDITYSPAKEVQKSAAFFSLWARRMYGHSTAAPQARNRSLNSASTHLCLFCLFPFDFQLSTVNLFCSSLFPYFIASISPPKSARTIPPSSIRSRSSLISAKLRTRTRAPGTPKTSPSAPPQSPRYKGCENPPCRTCKLLLVHIIRRAYSRYLLHRPGSTPSPSNTPSDIPDNYTGTHPPETSSADDRQDNESSSAHKTNSSAATWTTPTPIIGPHKPRLPPAATLPAHLANRISPNKSMSEPPPQAPPAFGCRTLSF